MLDVCGLKSVNKDSSKTGLMCLLTAVPWHCGKVERKRAATVGWPFLWVVRLATNP